ncbi:MAG: ATP synthase F1 subunit gamma [Lachnospiraceae bacterium]|nr:ATP synthase F1 subunit gamma [Lachnospiraceae bacterium]
MSSMRDIKRRKVSVESTEQITKAMKLVATVKLQKARQRAEESKPYFDKMYETVSSILQRSGNINNKYLKENGSTKKAVIVITGNRGLAGGYNTNITKLLTKDNNFKPEDVVVYNLGKKGKEILQRFGYEIKYDDSEVMNEPLYRDAMSLSERVLTDYENGEFGELYIAYTVFKNTVSHIPTLLKIIPVSKDEGQVSGEDKLAIMNYEPNEDDALSLIIPKYVTSIIYGGIIEAVASENGARMSAMDSATNNADEMIKDLGLLYNRARQSSITQELTEIIAGAEAIS